MRNAILSLCLFTALCTFCAHPLLGQIDPVSPFGEGDAESLRTGVTKANVDALIDKFVDRAEEAYCKQAPEGFLAWLKESPAIRKMFWLSLSPEHDKIPEAISILDTLRQKYPKNIEKYQHLAVAIAVVWDETKQVERSQRYTVWGVDDEQFPELTGPEEVFEYFTDPKYASNFVHKTESLPWPVLVHLVDIDTDIKERQWALSKYKGKRGALQDTYKDIDYDNDKVDKRPPRLGKNPYTLSNILKYGGICGDQSHFASRIAKSFGVPSMKVAGMGRFGGMGHAWCGYLITKGGKPLLEFTGRYRGDYYYTGTVFDPQTGQKDIERYIAMMYEGAAISYPAYMDSLVLARIAEQIRTTEPELSAELAGHAIRTNYFCKPAWELLMKHISDGIVSQKEGLTWFNMMVKKLRRHPDIIVKCLSMFVDCIPEDETAKRQKIYEQAFRLLRERPDLQIEMRINQCRELAESGLTTKAVALACDTGVKNAKEGNLLLPLLRQCVSHAKEAGIAKKLKGEFNKIEKDFPDERMGEVSKAFLDFKELKKSLSE